MNEITERKLKFIQKIGYGIGDFGSNYSWTFVASFVMLYFTNAVGLDAAVIGTIMLISRILDGFTDIFMGTIIDRTRTRMGKARFWYFVSCFPTALCVYLIFNIPGSFSEGTKYIYIFIVYTLMGAIFYTMNNIAYTTMSILVTRDNEERVQLTSYRYVFATLGVLVISATTSGLVDYFGGGQEGWRIVSVIYSLICLIGLLIPVVAVKELPEDENPKERKGKENRQNLIIIEDIKLLLKNKYFILGLAYYLVYYLVFGAFQALGIYYATYNLKDGGLLGALAMASWVPSIILLPFVSILTGKWGVRKASIYGYFFTLAGAILAYIGGIAMKIPLILLGLVIRSIGEVPITGGFNTLLAEADDYSLLRYGKRVTGSLFSCTSVGIKVGTGLGTTFCGFLLKFSRFDSHAVVQSNYTLNMIMNAYFLPYIIMSVMVIVILLFFDVEKQNYKLRGK